jgi:hypothetical protein
MAIQEEELRLMPRFFQQTYKRAKKRITPAKKSALKIYVQLK